MNSEVLSARYTDISDDYKTKASNATYAAVVDKPEDEKKLTKLKATIDRLMVEVAKTNEIRAQYDAILVKYSECKPKVGNNKGTGTLHKSINSIDGKLVDTVTKKNRSTVAALIKQMTSFVQKVEVWDVDIRKDGQLATYVADVVTYLNGYTGDNPGIVARCRVLVSDVGDAQSHDVGELVHLVNTLKTPPSKKRPRKKAQCVHCDELVETPVNKCCLSCFADDVKHRLNIVHTKEQNYAPDSKKQKEYETKSEQMLGCESEEYTLATAKKMHARISACEKMLKDVEYDEEDLSSGSDDDEDMDIDDDEDDDIVVHDEDMDDDDEDPLTGKEVLDWHASSPSEAKRQKLMKAHEDGNPELVRSIIRGTTGVKIMLTSEDKSYRIIPDNQPKNGWPTEADALAWYEIFKQGAGVDDWEVTFTFE